MPEHIDCDPPRHGRDHGERMRVGFDVIFGAFADLSREMRGWNDEEGGSSAAT